MTSKEQLEKFKKREELEKKFLEEYSRKAREVEQIEKDNEDIMKRMHPAVILPGLLVGIMVLVGCIYKGYMGW
tara:strand:+ start:945 stop:1163 length:219 start_codon:yes stop_codon:yes gene_type:complete